MKKKGSQERQLKAEVVVSIIIVITKSIKNTFDFMVVESSHRNCLDICLLDNALQRDTHSHSQVSEFECETVQSTESTTMLALGSKLHKGSP